MRPSKDCATCSIKSTQSSLLARSSLLDHWWDKHACCAEARWLISSNATAEGACCAAGRQQGQHLVQPAPWQRQQQQAGRRESAWAGSSCAQGRAAAWHVGPSARQPCGSQRQGLKASSPRFMALQQIVAASDLPPRTLMAMQQIACGAHRLQGPAAAWHVGPSTCQPCGLQRHGQGLNSP